MNDDRPEAARGLADVLVQENAALKRLDFPAAVALGPAKAAALAELVKQPAPQMGSTVTEQWLGELAMENQALLERAIAVQTRIVRIVARASAQSSAATRYNGYGYPAPSARADAMALRTRA
jgi:hypothetical protein